MLNIAYSGVNPNWLKGSYWLNKAPSSPFLSQAGTDPSVGNIREEKNHLQFVFTRSTIGQRTVLGAGQHSGWAWGISTWSGLWAALPGPVWAGRGVRPRSIPVAAFALLPRGDLLLLLCGCLHCQGTGKFPNILLGQQGKALGCSKTNCFSCKKPRGEEVTAPSLASSSCQQLPLEVIYSLLPSLHGYSVIPFCQNDPTFKSPF